MTDTRLLVCNCRKTMDIDGERLAQMLHREQPFTVYTELCRAQIEAYETALRTGDPLRVACTHQAALFAEVAETVAPDAALTFTNIRERSGWSSEGEAALAKTAALLADAAYVAKATGLTSLNSDGACLIYGRGQTALDAAAKLAGRLAVTLVLADADDVLLPSRLDFAVHLGAIGSATGHLGAFEVTFQSLADLEPQARDAAVFTPARQAVQQSFDLILDISGATPLFPATARRDGYLRADPGSPIAVAEAMFEASDLVGSFEKPLYVDYDADICAHSRSGKVGCSNCLDVCPTGAIAPDGDSVRIDPAICGGCGSCSGACPTGAINYAYPHRSDLIARAQIILAAFRGAGGANPVLLLHDETHGEGLINASARFGRGLPANVIPIAQHAIFQTGHEMILAMLASGASQIVFVSPPDGAHDLPALETQIALARAMASGLGHDADARLHVIDTADPDAFETTLYDLDLLAPLAAGSFATEGSKRDLARLAMAELAAAAPSPPPEWIELPAGAPYGRIEVDVPGCTLCLSCVSACPTGAITDDADQPQIAFTESACVQCGLCVATCPETVITLAPRYSLTPNAMTPGVIKTEEPFECVSCGKPFGTKSTVEAVIAKLEGHSMFPDESRTRLIQMCDDCRVVAVANSDEDPFRSGDRPKIRTTDDYLSDSPPSDDPNADRKPDDFLN